MHEQGSFTSTAQAPMAGLVMRPLSTGEVLDRTFVLYRRNFWLFASLGAAPAAVLSITAMLRIVYLALTHRTGTIVPGSSPDAVLNTVGTMLLMDVYFLPALLVFVVVYGLAHAAMMAAVTRLLQSMPTATAVDTYRLVRKQWLRWAGIALRQLWSLVWPMVPAIALFIGTAALIGKARGSANYAAIGILFIAAIFVLPGGIVWGAINFLRNSLAMSAGVSEDLGVNAAMRRSRALVAGRKGRIFLALLLVYALQMVAGGIQVPMMFLALRAKGAEHVLLQAIQLLVQFVTATVVAPVASIALCLFYVDERVRREGYDIELLMQRSFARTEAFSSTERSISPAADAGL